jgi:hypothetical protein
VCAHLAICKHLSATHTQCALHNSVHYTAAHAHSKHTLQSFAGSTAEWYGSNGSAADPVSQSSNSQSSASQTSTSCPPVLTVKAEGGCCWVVRLNRAAHDELLRQHPVAMAARVGKMMLVSMPLLLRVFDFGTTYGTLEAGEVRYR